jgi:hypothetical protein
VPSGSGEKAKGAILSRTVQYIHHLKENESGTSRSGHSSREAAHGPGDGRPADTAGWDPQDERGQRQRAEQELEARQGTGERYPASPEGGEEGNGERQKTELFSFRSCFCTISGHTSCRCTNPILNFLGAKVAVFLPSSRVWFCG